MKGTIEKGETPGQAALRELTEEPGISNAVIESDPGCWKANHRD
ncbi:NUDIX domain-containing protein [Pseudomonas poae]